MRPVSPLSHEEAVSLFVQRARLAGRDLPGDEVDEICPTRHRLPLAIELAASQLRVLGLVEIAARLQDQLQFRGRGSEESPRQRTLNDMVAWSHDLLPADTQRAFARRRVRFVVHARGRGGRVRSGRPRPHHDPRRSPARVPTSTSPCRGSDAGDAAVALDRPSRRAPMSSTPPDACTLTLSTDGHASGGTPVGCGRAAVAADWRLRSRTSTPPGWAEDNDPESPRRCRPGRGTCDGASEGRRLRARRPIAPTSTSTAAGLGGRQRRPVREPGDAGTIPWATEATATRELGDDSARHAAGRDWPGNQGRPTRPTPRWPRPRSDASRRQGRDARGDTSARRAWNRLAPTSTVKRLAGRAGEQRGEATGSATAGAPRRRPDEPSGGQWRDWTEPTTHRDGRRHPGDTRKRGDRQASELTAQRGGATGGDGGHGATQDRGTWRGATSTPRATTPRGRPHEPATRRPAEAEARGTGARRDAPGAGRRGGVSGPGSRH